MFEAKKTRQILASGQMAEPSGVEALSGEGRWAVQQLFDRTGGYIQNQLQNIDWDSVGQY
jgi:hypothetical protein